MRQFLLISFLFTCFFSKASIISVKQGSALSSLTKAIAIANSGDTILVYPGVYKEGNIIINKKLYLKGINYPVLDGEKKYEILSLKADGIIIEGFHIQHGGYSSYNDIAAIKIYNASN